MKPSAFAGFPLNPEAGSMTAKEWKALPPESSMRFELPNGKPTSGACPAIASTACC
jgi:hypothetical protein